MYLFLFRASILYVFTGDVAESGKDEVIKVLALLLEIVSTFAKTEKLNVWIKRSNSLYNIQGAIIIIIGAWDLCALIKYLYKANWTQ